MSDGRQDQELDVRSRNASAEMRAWERQEPSITFSDASRFTHLDSILIESHDLGDCANFIQFTREVTCLISEEHAVTTMEGTQLGGCLCVVQRCCV